MYTFGGSLWTLRCHLVGTGGTPRGHFRGIGWTAIGLQRTHSGLATQALADTVLDFLKEAWVPVDTDPGPPEECTLDSIILNGRSEKTQVNKVWHSTDLDSLLVEAAAAAA